MIETNYPCQAMTSYIGLPTTIMKHIDGSVNYVTSVGESFELLDDQIFGEEGTPEGIYFAHMMLGTEGRDGDKLPSQDTMVSKTERRLFNRQKPKWKIFDYVTRADYEDGICELCFINRWSYLKEHIPTQFLAFDMECLEQSHLDMFIGRVKDDGWKGAVCIAHDYVWTKEVQVTAGKPKQKDIK